MAWATCTKCGAEVHWRNGRGARMADLRCSCGGSLRAYRKHPGKPRDVAARIKTPPEYREYPLRQYFRVGAAGYSEERCFGPEPDYTVWPADVASRMRENREQQLTAFRAGRATRQALLAKEGTEHA